MLSRRPLVIAYSANASNHVELNLSLCVWDLRWKSFSISFKHFTYLSGSMHSVFFGYNRLLWNEALLLSHYYFQGIELGRHQGWASTTKLWGSYSCCCSLVIRGIRIVCWRLKCPWINTYYKSYLVKLPIFLVNENAVFMPFVMIPLLPTTKTGDNATSQGLQMFEVPNLAIRFHCDPSQWWIDLHNVYTQYKQSLN